MRRILATISILLLIVLATVQGVSAITNWQQPDKIGAAANPEVMHSAGHVLVRFNEDAIAAGRVDAAVQHIFGAWYKMPVLPGETPIDAVHRYAASPDVELAELDYIIGLAPQPRLQADSALRA
ncbi:MAG TPA: hypothetical protein G4N94_03430, partial [Caldilineae bacterium]|nr:hypothetical protein [Caldilineae bacterium]